MYMHSGSLINQPCFLAHIFSHVHAHGEREEKLHLAKHARDLSALVDSCQN